MFSHDLSNTSLIFIFYAILFSLMESTKKITSLNKQSNDYFSFLIDNEHINDNYVYYQEFLGYPKFPLIGHYSRSDYSFGTIMLLVKCNIDILQGANEDQFKTQYDDFVPPKEVIDYLNINKEIEIENNGKTKNNIFYPKNKIKFHFVISSIPDSSMQIKKKEATLNLVPHLYLTGDDPLFQDGKSRTVFDYPICLFDTKPFKTNIKEDKSKRGILFNNLRLEYSSIHMKKGSLALSPNNLQYYNDNTSSLSQFYVVICEKEKNYHSVFYYITVNNDKEKKTISDLINTSKTLKEVIEGLKVLYEDTDKDIIQNLTSLFKL